MFTCNQNVSNNLAEPLLSADAVFADEVKEDSNEVVININKKLTDNNINKESINGLNLAIAILSSQLSRHNNISRAKTASIYSLMTLLSGVSAGMIYYYLDCKSKFNLAVSELDSTLQPNPYGYDIPAELCSAVSHVMDIYGRDFVNTDISSSCDLVISLEQSVKNFLCADGLQEICDGPGMFKGFSLLTIGAGIVLPFILSALTSFMLCDNELTFKLTDLPADKLETIKRKSALGGIDLSNLEDSKVEDVKAMLEKELACQNRKIQRVKSMAQTADQFLLTETTDIIASYMHPHSAEILPIHRRKFFSPPNELTASPSLVASAEPCVTSLSL
jgi:hypothetical protein